MNLKTNIIIAIDFHIRGYEGIFTKMYISLVVQIRVFFLSR